MEQRLIEVYWNVDDQSWTVRSRADVALHWLTHQAADGQLANLLSIAHDNATGG